MRILNHASDITIQLVARCERQCHLTSSGVDNDVIDGIRETATAMSMDLIKVSPSIKEWKEEMEGYVWDTTDGEDRPVKIADHFCDSTRYFVFTEKLVPKALRRK